ncbi:MAG: class I SAM-dependent methyltransferase, partial [Anaerolineaceae bacterium]|nr:class I SAM-dependent methyltransferase [Anaerolineaceae bacterium]
MSNLSSRIQRILYAARCREDQFDEQHHAALRLFNGFYEGEPELVIDLFGATLLIYDYAQHPDVLQSLIDQLVPALLEEFPWIQAVLLKRRESKDEDQRKGIFLFGSKADHWIHELDVRYALDLRMNQDASFYLDTRPLRAWLRYRMNSKSVLNTFAY